MELFTIHQVSPRINPDYNDEYFSDDIDNALARGYDPELPIIIDDEDGEIIDGNHRFVAFSDAGRKEELFFAKVKYAEYLTLQSSIQERGEYEKWIHDDEFFYDQIKKILL